MRRRPSTTSKAAPARHRTGFEVSLRVSTMAVVLCGYLALTVTPRFPTGLLTVPAVVFALAPIGEWCDRRFGWYRRLTMILSMAYLVFIPISLSFMDLLGSVVSLVVYIQTYVLLHEKAPRSYFYLFLMSFFLFLASCVLMPDPEVGLIMLVYLIGMTIAAMSLHFHVERLGSADGRRVDIVNLGEGEARLEPAPRHVLDLGVAGAVAVVCIASILITVGMFVVTPRMEAGLLGRTDPGVFRTGLDSPGVNLTEGGTLATDTRAIMRVEFPELPGGRYNRPMYWRSSTLPEYDRAQWRRRELSSDEEEPAFSLLQATSGLTALFSSVPDRVNRPPLGRPQVHQRIYLDQVPSDGIPVLTLVLRAEALSSNPGALLTWSRVNDYSVRLGSGQSSWLQYEAWSEIEKFEPDDLRAAPANYRERLNALDYALLTEHDLSPETAELARRLTEGADNVYDRAVAIRDYLSGPLFIYSREIPSLPEEGAIDVFVNRVRRGHCELYASSMALMLRSLGIPSRVVSGYRGGEWSGLDQAYLIRANMAHLWVEAYLLGVGWVTFDPSPGDPELRLASNVLMRTLSRYGLRAKMIWYSDVVGFNQGVQMETLRSLGVGFVGFGASLFEQATGVGGADSSTVPLLSGAMAFVALVGLLPLVLLRRRAVRRKRSEALTADQRRAVRLFRRFRRALEGAGVACHGRTADEMARGAEVLGAGVAGPAQALAKVYNEVRFGGRPLTRDQFRGLKALLRQIGVVEVEKSGDVTSSS